MPRSRMFRFRLASRVVATLAGVACSPPAGLADATPARVTVEFDFDHRPLPEIPLPNDIATRPDAESPTGRRINASMLAPTGMERRVRRLLDDLDGWGVYQPISIPFSGALDVDSILDAHRDDDYDQSDDVVYLIDIDRDSPEFGRAFPVDLGNGNYPRGLESSELYGANDPRGWTLSLAFEEADEDVDHDGVSDPGEVDANANGVVDPDEDENGNGYLDPPEDTDADGVLDRPNYLPGRTPGRDDLAGRSDALMTFYERETNTLMLSPLVPLRDETTYAVVITRRLLDADGDPVGSPFPIVNHAAQTEDLRPVLEVLPEGVDVEDIAFAFCFTTQSLRRPWIAVREGLYGHGPQAHLAEQFPAELSSIAPLKDAAGNADFAGRTPYVLHTEDWAPILPFVLNANPDAAASGDALVEAHRYVDFHVMGVFRSPQLFFREDEEGNPLPFDEQSWPSDLDHAPVAARSEDVHFWLTVPRKEVSVRGQGKPAPLVVLSHGYGSNRAETLLFGAMLAQFGLATLEIDSVSHGLTATREELAMVESLLAVQGLTPVVDALFSGRTVDFDGDGVGDSGADYWTAYLFHTRDMLRQTVLDFMQLLRIVRTWDGTRTWRYDGSGGGPSGLAGDFDGDGVLDVGGGAPIYAAGASLGGIVSTLVAAVEPQVEVVAPIVPGGRLFGIGSRSQQSGVPEAVALRAMGPLYLVDLATDGTATVSTQVTELNRDTTLPITTLTNILPGDTLVAHNLQTGERRCAYLLPVDDQRWAAARVGLPGDAGDAVELSLYRGPVLDVTDPDCGLAIDADPIAVVDELDAPVVYAGQEIPAGPLRTVTEGLGLRRANPELRRFMGIGQMVLDAADPASHARFLNADPIVYPEVGDRTHANALFTPTIGDMGVPVNGGITLARAAGLIDYTHPDPRYGVPVNQVLIDTYTTEGVHTYRRHAYTGDIDPELLDAMECLGIDQTRGVHVDVDNFSDGTDLWGDTVPRLDPPLRLVSTVDADGNDLGGYSGVAFTYARPYGMHGFDPPSGMATCAVELCKAQGGGMSCNELIGETFDAGWNVIHMLGAYLRSGAQQYPIQAGCNSRTACNDLPDPPEPREATQLP